MSEALYFSAHVDGWSTFQIDQPQPQPSSLLNSKLLTGPVIAGRVIKYRTTVTTGEDMMRCYENQGRRGEMGSSFTGEELRKVRGFIRSERTARREIDVDDPFLYFISYSHFSSL